VRTALSGCREVKRNLWLQHLRKLSAGVKAEL